MPNSNNFTFFGSAVSNAAADSTSQYLNYNFLNTTEAPTLNTGFTSTALTNPASFSFANDDMPRYQAKTVYVADLLLIADRTRWINNRPTYQIIWSEQQPHIQGYAWGNIRLKNSNFGKTISVGDIGDGIAINGVIRNIGWLVNSTTDSTGTAEKWTDGVDTSSTISYGGAAVDSYTYPGLNKYNFILHSATLQTRNIHEYRLIANQYKNLSVAGVVAYFENSTTDIDQFWGNTYVAMQRQNTIVGTHIALPSISGNLGGRSSITKNNFAQYSLNTVATSYVSTVGVGSSGTNLVTVTTGQGASFPIGSGVVAINGTSHYVGNVTNVSTDTLTVTPTLSIGLSGLMFRSWQAGPTFAISASLYSLAFTIDPKNSNNLLDQNGFGGFTNGTLFFSEPEGRYRAWGGNLTVNNIEGYQGVNFISNTLGFFQVDGNFCAAEVEIAGAGIIHGTFSINGVPSWGINEGVSAIIRKTIFTNGGPGWNSFSFTPGQSLINTNFFRINLYNQVDPIGVTSTLLGSFDTPVTAIHRNGDVANATLMPLGNWQRTYADQCYFSGQWARGITSGVAGGVQYLGTSTNSALSFQYYGTDFEILGTVGTSANLTLDGASIGCSLGIRIPVSGGATFHSVVFTHKTGNSFVSGFDFLKSSVGEIKNNQMYSPRAEFNTMPRVFNQQDTPRNPRDFDVWASDKFGKLILIYLFGKWNQLLIGNQIDDPNDQAMYKLHGSTDTSSTGGSNTVEVYNFFSWSTPAATSTINSSRGHTGDGAYSGNIYWLTGLNTSGNAVNFTEKFNKISFVSLGVNRTSGVYSGGIAVLNNTLVAGGGQTSGGETANVDTFNGVSWTTAVATVSTGAAVQGCFVQGGTVHWAGGALLSGSSYTTTHNTFNGTSTGTATAYSASDSSSVSASYNNVGIAGAQHNAGTASYVWSGSWSANIAMTFSDSNKNMLTGNEGQMACAFAGMKVYVNGGVQGSSPSNRSLVFNGTAWAADVSSNLSLSGVAGGVS